MYTDDEVNGFIDPDSFDSLFGEKSGDVLRVILDWPLSDVHPKLDYGLLEELFDMLKAEVQKQEISRVNESSLEIFPGTVIVAPLKAPADFCDIPSVCLFLARSFETRGPQP